MPRRPRSPRGTTDDRQPSRRSRSRSRSRSRVCVRARAQECRFRCRPPPSPLRPCDAPGPPRRAHRPLTAA
ncbi:hypothetical protein EAO70_09075 [Streptomyces sp. adm13(2018)]|nr:hypothetical protein EAO70_09075 [Streptomyces sp. adm13(2018)]